MKAKLSIVIACFNDPDVVTAVESARAQTYCNKEIIVVDDGSNLPVAGMIEELSGRVDHVILQKNLGQSIARNRGIKKGTGEYILNLDSDDFFEPTFCEKAIELMDKDPEVKIVTCKAERFNKKGSIDIYTPAGGDYINFLTSNSALGSSMFRREDWMRCAGYEETLPVLGFEDWELYLNILKEGGRAAVLNEVLFHYQVRENSTTARIKDMKHDKYQQIVLKHRDLYVQHFDILITELFAKIKKEENEKLKMSRGAEFSLGNKILAPLKYLKRKLQ
ncbi:glycosyltransferase family 2 protein [Antarcticibacterium flavum]|uniref:Glycosyltransferase family 2 protein n=1 Tax=Antarcticibacterium flavum TaxID=2058175 RepID=A0A5B7X553_9FLAO|nr:MULTISPECIES: glycosyltransferase family 2 protein [Antarcticibacterium]MCM4161400.1 glycosyl transferase family 2 [Antarcticibacterium sp. W02-3]QCY70576.1 glycosyltransferase family 2 protein [Antarcticibacterium flavum]